MQRVGEGSEKWNNNNNDLENGVLLCYILMKINSERQCSYLQLTVCAVSDWDRVGPKKLVK
jgi:hypothetical protein